MASRSTSPHQLAARRAQVLRTASGAVLHVPKEHSDKVEEVDNRVKFDKVQETWGSPGLRAFCIRTCGSHGVRRGERNRQDICQVHCHLLHLRFLFSSPHALLRARGLRRARGVTSSICTASAARWRWSASRTWTKTGTTCSSTTNSRPALRVPPLLERGDEKNVP